MSNEVPYRTGIHRLATLLAGYVVLLITAGGLVKSLEAGLSVPDWPLSYGMLNPPRWWQIETVRAEHGHRLIAGVALLLTVALVVWVVRRDPRAWVRRLAVGALAVVFAQAALGGITVLFFLPTVVSVSHAGLAQLFLALCVTLALVTSRFWSETDSPGDLAGRIRSLALLATFTTIAIYVQILVGAVMRHTGAGLAIPDFPLAFGSLIPPRFDTGIAVHYSHRVGALLVATLIFWTLGRVLRISAGRRALTVPAKLLAVLVLLQGTLGGLVVLTGKGVLPNTLHVGGGALIFGTSLILTLSSWRLSWLARQQVGPALAARLETLEPEQVAS